jgi:hypothetical protein
VATGREEGGSPSSSSEVAPYAAERRSIGGRRPAGWVSVFFFPFTFLDRIRYAVGSAVVGQYIQPAGPINHALPPRLDVVGSIRKSRNPSVPK